MAILAQDTFTDVIGTFLEAHTPDSGGTWIEHPANAAGNHVITDQNRLRCSAGTSAYYLDTVLPVEYDLECDLFVKSLIGSWGIMSRMSSVSPLEGYFLRWTPTTGLWELFKFVAGASTLITSATQSYSVGQQVHVKLITRDAYKAVETDGVELLRTTDNAVAAAGFAGIRSNNGVQNTTGPHYDNFTVSVPSVPDLEYPTQVTLSQHTANVALAARQTNVALQVHQGNVALSPSVVKALALSSHAANVALRLHTAEVTLKSHAGGGAGLFKDG